MVVSGSVMGQDRPMARLVILTVLFWLPPNGEAAWVHDRLYDLCMVTAGDDDWTCEDRLVALGE
jgi:hypothetical protein